MTTTSRISAAVLRAEVIAADAKPAADGITIQGATIEGALDLSGVAIDFPLSFIDCRFERELILRGAALESIFIGGCTAPCIDAAGLRLRADFQLCEGTHVTGPVRLAAASIAGSLSCNGATLEAPGDDALSADSATIGGHLFMGNGFASTGRVSLRRTQIGGTIYCAHGRFEHPGAVAIAADDAVIGDNVVMSHGFKARGEVSLHGARIRGYLYCAHGTFENWGENPGAVALAADHLELGGRAFLGEWFNAKGAVHLRDATIAGDLHCVGGIFQNPGGVALDADRIKVGGGVRMHTRFLAQGAVSLKNATIGGGFNCTGGQFEHRGGVALTAEGATIGRDVLLGSGFRADGAVCFDRATIAGVLDDEDARCDGLTSEGAVIAGASPPK